MTRLDLYGQKFGRLTVVGYVGVKNQSTLWKCLCDCNTEVIRVGKELKHSDKQGTIQSCGCYIRETICANKRSNLIGQQFGRLTVIEMAGVKNQKTQWKVRCSCGNVVIRTGSQLNSSEKKGAVQSCGCYAKEFTANNKRLNLIGQKFGRLTIIGDLGTKNGRSFWKALCDCSKQIEVTGHSLKQGKTVSCGCKKLEVISELGRRTSHGHTRGGQSSHEWKCWCAMKQRCYYPKHKSYDAYGGRGISICPHWRDNFENFLADMGEAPSIKHQIDRIDNDGDYTPENCRWALPQTQSRNRSSNRLISYQGVTKTLADWCEELDLNYNSVINRLNTLNWDVDRAFNTPTPTGYQKRPNWRLKKKERLKLSPVDETI